MNPMPLHIALPLLLGGALLGPAAAASPAAAPGFDPVVFFAGRTSGEGTLKKIMSAVETTRVTGFGRIEGDVMVLDQTVAIAGEPVRKRQWRLRQIAPGRWSGTLSDARGSVNASAAGAVLTIAYVSKAGMAISQTLTLAPGGQSAHNVMKVRKLGFTVATLDETITRD